MKKTLLITVGIILVLIVVLVWLYLFVWGTPENKDEIFARFGLGGDAEEQIFVETIPESFVDTSDTTYSGEPQRLRQLTTTPVIGATFLTDVIRYMEAGTGHIYDISIQNGQSTLVDGTTMPSVSRVTFAASGTLSLTESQIGQSERVMISPVQGSGSALSDVILPNGAREVFVSSDGTTAYYLLDTSTGAAGYSYVLEDGETTRLFTTPLRDVEILWGEDIYLYTTPSITQEGHIYAVSDSTLSYLTKGMNGLLGTKYGEGVVVTGFTNDRWVSKAFSNDSSEELARVVIPEKCAAHPIYSDTLYCAVPRTLSPSFPDDWYKGTISFTDALWLVDTTVGTGGMLYTDLLEESGREIDVMQLGVSPDGRYLYFINKNDGALWLYDTELY